MDSTNEDNAQDDADARPDPPSQDKILSDPPPPQPVPLAYPPPQQHFQPQQFYPNYPYAQTGALHSIAGSTPSGPYPHTVVHHQPPHYMYQMLDNSQPQPYVVYPSTPYMQHYHNPYAPTHYAPFQHMQMPHQQAFVDPPAQLPANLQASHNSQKRQAEDAVSARSGDSDDKQPKKRRKKDPNAPKNPVSAYLFYVADQRVKNTGKSDGKSFAEVAKDLGRKWKNLSNEEKEPYIEHARKDKERYEKEKADYKTTRQNKVEAFDSGGSQNVSRDSRSSSIVDMHLPAEIEVSLAPSTRFVHSSVPPVQMPFHPPSIYPYTHSVSLSSAAGISVRYEPASSAPPPAIPVTPAAKDESKPDPSAAAVSPKAAVIVSQPADQSKLLQQHVLQQFPTSESKNQTSQ